MSGNAYAPEVGNDRRHLVLFGLFQRCSTQW